MRGNNPGNLRRWGANPVVGGFAVFPSIKAGLEGMEGQLSLYFSRGLNTLQKIINTWAPSADHNPTVAYIQNVSKSSSFDENQVLDWTHPAVKGRIMYGMIKQEQGGFPLSTGLLRQVVGMAEDEPLTGPFAPFENAVQPVASAAPAVGPTSTTAGIEQQEIQVSDEATEKLNEEELTEHPEA